MQTLSAFDGNGDVAFTADLGRRKRTKISGYQGVRYQPYYQFNFLAGSAPSEAGSVRTRDNALTTRQSREYDGRFQIAENLGRRTSLAFDYAYRVTTFGESGEPFQWQLANGRFIRNLTKNAALRVGYGYGQAQEGLQWDSASIPTRNAVLTQNIDIGMDYKRPLALSRRTSVNFASGSSIVTYQGTRYYRLLADASVIRELGRTWNARAVYHRGAQFVEGFAGPLYADIFQFRVGGLITRRFDFGVSSGYSNGVVGLSATDRGYLTYSGLADLRMALTRTLSFNAQYLSYHYDFDRGTPLPFGVPRTLNRQGLRFGLSGWLPLSR